MCRLFVQGVWQCGGVVSRSRMSEQNCVLLNWNVKGLNYSARRQVVKDLARDTKCNIVALQETKLDNFTAAIVRETLGEKFAANFAFLPAQGTRGGALIAVDEDLYTIQRSEFRSHSVTALLKSVRTQEEWWATVVYGPQWGPRKIVVSARVEGVDRLGG